LKNRHITEKVNTVQKPMEIYTPPNTQGPLFELEIKNEREYIPLLNDLIRMVVIHFVTQLLFSLGNPVDFPFWTSLFLETVIYMCAGICVYWLIIRRIFTFI
jgi:hypothetical protein